jgi:hypothetical protein
MYLSKQWRESRYITAIAVLGLVLLLYGVIKASLQIDPAHLSLSQNGGDYTVIFAPIFYIEAALLGFWGWLIASIGAGKNLGEDSGSFLFTRPRSRAWFLWNDWGFALAQIASIILLTNLMVGLLIARLLKMESALGRMHLANGYALQLSGSLLLVGAGALLFGGLVYSVTYFSTIVLKRAIGVMLGAGILVGYVILDGLLRHYYSIHLPSLIPNLFRFEHQTPIALADHLGISLVSRTIVMLLFPLAAQFILERSEI